MKNLASYLLLLLFIVFSVDSYAQRKDPVRDKLKWDKLAAPSNSDGEIEKIYFGYTRPDGKHFNLNSELTFPIPAEEFMGGDVYEKDINFDGIPDIQISLGFISGYGAELFDAWVWNPKKHIFENVELYSNIVNPEIDAENKRIMSYNHIDDVIEINEWKWVDGQLKNTDRAYQDANDDYTPTPDEHLMQCKALVGEWWWVDDGQLPSDIQLILNLDIEDATLYCSEAQIYGSNAAFDLDCSYNKGILTLTDAFGASDELSSLKLRLQLNPRGDLYGTFECTVGEHYSKGTVTLRMKE